MRNQVGDVRRRYRRYDPPSPVVTHRVAALSTSRTDRRPPSFAARRTSAAPEDARGESLRKFHDQGYFCPSCHAKRLAIWTQWLDTSLLAPVPHRQVVLTIPTRLRAYCLYRRRLLGEIARVATRTVTAAIRTLTGERDLTVGIVACLQTHGSHANWHPPLHRLVTDGGVRPDGTFVSWPAHDTARLTEAFRLAVLRFFVRLELFDEAQAAGMLTWPHSGFHVHTAVWVPEDDRAFATRLARYCARNPVALGRLTYNRAATAVTYR